VIAAHAGEAAFEVAEVEELVDDLRDDRSQKAAPGLIAFLTPDWPLSSLIACFRS
jgi:hypothetical protein